MRQLCAIIIIIIITGEPAEFDSVRQEKLLLVSLLNSLYTMIFYTILLYQSCGDLYDIHACTVIDFNTGTACVCRDDDLGRVGQ